MRCVAYYHMLDNVMPCPDAVTLNISKRASSLLRRPHALSTVICVSVVSPSLALIMVYCAVCSLLVHRVCHHRQHQLIPPLPRLAGPPAPSYRWIHEMRYGEPAFMHTILLLLYTSVRCSIVHSTALRASMCCNGAHDTYAVSMEDTVILSCVCHYACLC